MRLPEVLEGLTGEESRAAGRKTVWHWAPAWMGGGTLVVRQFAHGGLLGGLWGTVFPRAAPMLRELRVALHARAESVLTCRPIALRIERVFGPLLRAHYLTQQVPESLNVLEMCRRAVQGSPPSPARRQVLAKAVAGTIAAMHEVGIRHGDLHVKNLLVTVQTEAPRAYVVDFKKARLRTEVSLREGLRNLVRLDRSVLKWPASREAITLTDRLRVLREYVRLRSGAAGDWKQLARRLRTGHAAHALTRK